MRISDWSSDVCSSDLSRKVQELEARLGAQLLHRTTRKLGLTEAGNVYYEHSQRIARELDEAESAVSQLQGGPRGWLRVTAPYSLGIERIAPLLGEFQIGSASCRERVCPYVSISAVAVSLKQKTQTNTQK